MDMLIADDQAMQRELIRSMLENAYPEASIYEAENFDQVKSTCDKFKPQVLILDLIMPGMCILMGVNDIVQQFQDTRILVCSVVDNPVLVCTILAFGVKGYISKNMPADKLLQGIDSVLHGGTYVPEQFRSIPVHLTKRQAEIFSMICSGLCNKEIARRLHISTNTVKFHVGLIFKALGVQTRNQAIMLCGLTTAQT